MALERIDPILLEDCYAVDHLLRYALAAELVHGRRVLDAACGLGFGSVLLLHQQAGAVVGVDISADAIATCSQRWQHDNLKFLAHDLERLEEAGLGEFDVVTSFETLEHVRDPGRVAAAFRKSLKADGVLVGSVPGETDREDDNEFHFHQFTAASLRALLAAHFPHVRLFRQDFRIASAIAPADAAGGGEPLCWRQGRALEIDFGRAGPKADTFVFIASAAPLPPVDFAASASSRNAWLRLRAANRTLQGELNAFADKYRRVFLEHGDLKVKFANMLGWGVWHYEKATGEAPADSYLDRIAKEGSAREAGLREQVAALQQENLELKQRLAAAEDFLGGHEQACCDKFEEAGRCLKKPE